jgi:hypothetical protein
MGEKGSGRDISCIFSYIKCFEVITRCRKISRKIVLWCIYNQQRRREFWKQCGAGKINFEKTSQKDIKLSHFFN